MNEGMLIALSSMIGLGIQWIMGVGNYEGLVIALLLANLFINLKKLKENEK